VGDGEVLMGKLLPVVKPPVIAPVVELAPFYDPERDGITYSLLSGWLACRELAKLNLRGWTSRSTSMAFTFGNVVHELLERVAVDVLMQGQEPTHELVLDHLLMIEDVWKKENPLAGQKELEFIELTMLLAEPLLQLYFDHWKEDHAHVEWLALEKEFKIPLEIQTRGGKKSTFIRGKMDGVFRRDDKPRPWLLETKTKTRVDEGTLVEVLPYEWQVNIYMQAIKHIYGKYPRGVLYNVIRRPGLRQKVKESLPQFSKRILDDIQARPDWYFIRMEMQVDAADVRKFELDLLDIATDFLNWWYGFDGHYKNSGNCENKYGVCHFLAICGHQNFIPFYKREKVFRELEEI
jgi:hypothetical protein